MNTHYAKKIETVIAYIHEHFDEELRLEHLAKIAGISPYHFHRIFRAIMDETIGELVLRIRMEKAIRMLLLERHKTVLEIALDVGFTNPSSFSRAFKRYFGFSASDLLGKKSTHNSNLSTLKSKYGKELKPADLYPVNMFNNTGDKTMKVKIVTQEPQFVIGLESNYTHDATMAVLVKLHNWYQENKGDVVSKWHGVGIYRDDPSVTPLEKCKGKKCLILDKPVQLSAPFICETIPGGRYAIATYTVKEEEKKEWGNRDYKADDFHNFIQSFIKHWLLESGYESDHYPLLMYYHSNQEGPLRDANGNLYFEFDSIDLAIKLKG